MKGTNTNKSHVPILCRHAHMEPEEIEDDGDDDDDVHDGDADDDVDENTCMLLQLQYYISSPLHVGI